jgi:chaperone BCS1
VIHDALEASVRERSTDFNVYVQSSSWMGGWERALSKKPREVDSVVLDENLAQELLHDARNFMTGAEWYAQRGIPYRRGYLLYGPPGSRRRHAGALVHT